MHCSLGLSLESNLDPMLVPPIVRHSLPVEETKRKLPDFDGGRAVHGRAQIARRSDMDMNGEPGHFL